MQEQKKIIKRYKDLYKNPTLQEIADNTGIQITRVFRIINFAPMKLSEYLIFKEQINKKINTYDSLNNLFETSMNELSVNTITEIKSFIKRKLKMKELMKEDNQKGARYA